MQLPAIKQTVVLAFACAGLLACARYESGPAPTGATAGSAGRPLEQRTFQQPHSAPVSQGAPTLSGGDTSGRPSVERSGPGSGDLGGSPEVQPRGTRGGRRP
jgi:hypothetical protein